MKNYIGFYGQTNKWTHDHSFCKLGSETIDYVQLERITRKKFDNKIPNYLVKFLNFFSIDLLNLNDYEIGYANTFSLNNDLFFKKSENNIQDSKGKVNFKHGGSDLLKEIIVNGNINGISVEATIVPHEIAHIFSSIPFYGKFNNNSLLIHIDGAASICNASAWHYKDNKLNLLAYEQKFHNAVINFSNNDLAFDILGIKKIHSKSMPGKLMGFSSFGDYSEEKIKWLENRRFFQDYSKDSRDIFLKESKSLFNYALNKIEQSNKHIRDITACIQEYFNRKLFEFIIDCKNISNSEYLYYSGGAALNIKLNSKIIDAKLFKEVFIPPPAGDSGLSLGVSYYLMWKDKNNLPVYDVYINNCGLNHIEETKEYSIDDITKDLLNNKVIGLFVGEAEAGPRALCHRSIIANPCDKKMKKRVSEDIKKREWYRPIAPVVLEENLNVIFENFTNSRISDFMLYEFKVKTDIINKIPAVVHIDNTARAQVVRSDNSKLNLIREILEIMDSEYDIPCLINTSFNGKNEPIVHTEEEAFNTAKEIGLDSLILNNRYIKLRN